MDKEKKVKIRCINPSCKKWFNATISSVAMNNSLSATANSTKVQCPHCGRMTECNKEDIQ